MKPRRLSVFVLWIVIISGCLVLPVSAQRMPREDVVDVSAIGEGLCVSNLFQANMVLQRDKPIHVWGWAAPGEEVTVAFAGGQGSVRTGDDRAWKVTLPAVPANGTSQQMTVTGQDQTLVLDNILVGDVWVLGGQSNMEFELAKVENGNLEIISANYPQIRILTVPYGEGPDPRKSFAPFGSVEPTRLLDGLRTACRWLKTRGLLRGLTCWESRIRSKSGYSFGMCTHFSTRGHRSETAAV